MRMIIQNLYLENLFLPPIFQLSKWYYPYLEQALVGGWHRILCVLLFLQMAFLLLYMWG